MKLLLALLALSCISAFGQVGTSVFAYNPAVGIRFYSSVEQAEPAIQFEANARCATPGAPADCDLLKKTTQFGVVVFVKTSDPEVTLFAVTAKYVDATGKEQQMTEYTTRWGDTGMALFWIGKPLSVKVTAVALRPAGLPMTN
jgi:hypothetical protein